jgi:hypothetical protein
MRCVSFSPDGRLLAVGDRSGSLQVWEMNSGARVLEIAGDQGAIHRVCFSPDGRTVATAGSNSTVLLWDLAPGRLVSLKGRARDKEGALRLWADLSSNEAAKGYEAVWSLIAAPEAAAELLKARLCSEPPDVVEGVIKELDDDNARTRDQATLRLKLMGPPAISALRNAKTASPEAQDRIKRLLSELTGPVSASPGILRWHRAAQVLEAIATERSLQVLQAVAERLGPGRERDEFQSSVERSRRRITPK